MKKSADEMMNLLDTADRVYDEANTEGRKIIYDGDCILKDQGLDVNPGIYREISRIYRAAEDKKAVAELFEILTDMPFDIYLEECISKTSTASAKE